jgi:hypothetical protein
VPTVPCRWCLIKCTREKCASAKSLCAKCAVVCSCFSVGKANDKSARAKNICARCAASLVSVSSVQETNVPVPKVSVSVSTKPTTRAREPTMSVPTVPCRWCLVKCTREKCASAKRICAKCAVAVVSVSAKPTRRALEPEMSVPTVPLRWCLYQVCQRQVCPLCRFSGVVCSSSRRSTVVTTILLLYHYNDHYNFFFYTIA